MKTEEYGYCQDIKDIQPSSSGVNWFFFRQTTHTLGKGVLMYGLGNAIQSTVRAKSIHREDMYHSQQSTRQQHIITILHNS